MKKLLILMLVLGMTSLASAAITSPMVIVDLGGGTFAIDLPSGMSQANDSAGGYWVLAGDATDPILGGLLAATIDPVLNLSNIHGDSAGWGLIPYGIVGEFTTSSVAAWTAAPGIYADSFTSTTTTGTLTLYAYSDDLTTYSVADTFIVPEPMTIALLGLGGLFLLRRRK